MTDADWEWRTMDRFVLRRPGFPFDWLLRLRFSRSVTAARRLLASQALQAELQRAFVEDLFPRLCDAEQRLGRERATFRFWYRLAREVRAGRALDPITETDTVIRPYREVVEWVRQWQTACADRERQTREGESVFAAELVERRCALRDLAREPRVQEALWLSNPAMYEVGLRYLLDHWEAARRPSKIKHIERRLYSYLQRLCAKNDTTSFFGPLDYGYFDASQRVSVDVAREPVRARRSFFAYWAAAALAQRIADDPSVRPHLRPRHDPLRPGPGDGLPARIYRASDGTLSIAELAVQVGESEATVTEVVSKLIDQSILHLDLAIPPACLDPLAFLARRVSSLSAEWSRVLDDLRSACERFATADFDERRALLCELEQRYSELMGQPARRGNGQMFQDRTLLYEECLGNVAELRLDESHWQRIAESLAPMARLSHAVAEMRHAELRQHALALFERLSQGGQPIRFVDLLAAWRRCPPSPHADDLLERFAGLVEQRQRGRVSSLRAAEVLDLCPPPLEHSVLSPDVLLAARDLDALRAGEYQVVLGEIHHGLQPVGWMLAFVDDPVEWDARLLSCLPASSPEHTPANLIFGRRMKSAPPELPGPSVVASATSIHGDALELHMLTVERRDGDLRLRVNGAGPSLQFYPPSFGVPPDLFAPFACFSYPLVDSVSIRLGAHTPRIEIDGAIFQRERWEVSSASVPAQSGFQLLIAGLALQARLGAPEWVFIRSTAEPKPVLIDFHNVFSLELLSHLAGAVDSLTLTEMMPGHDDLWLEDGRGRFTAELRTVMAGKSVN